MSSLCSSSSDLCIPGAWWTLPADQKWSWWQIETDEVSCCILLYYLEYTLYNRIALYCIAAHYRQSLFLSASIYKSHKTSRVPLQHQKERPLPKPCCGHKPCSAAKTAEISGQTRTKTASMVGVCWSESKGFVRDSGTEIKLINCAREQVVDEGFQTSWNLRASSAWPQPVSSSGAGTPEAPQCPAASVTC